MLPPKATAIKTSLALFCVCASLVHFVGLARADIFRWDDGQLIPGTEGITPGPGVVLDHHELAFAALLERNLTGARFDFSNLASANLQQSTLTNANLTGAVVTGASFAETTSRGFTLAQLVSTASYQTKNLQGIGLNGNNLTGWNLSRQNLTSASLSFSTMTNTNLARANLTNASLFSSTLTNADLTGADTRGALNLNLTGATSRNAILPDGTIAGLNLAVGETLVAYADVAIAVKLVGAFSIDPTAKLDLTDNAAIVDYSGASPATTVREKMLSGRGGSGVGGAWTGTGITSSTTAAANQAQPDSRSLGYADNATLPLGAYTSFHGAAVDETSILIAFTRTGDANLDGVVNDDEVTIIGATYAPGVSQPHWALGDFDYNGFVDDDDVTLLGAFYDPSAPPLAAPIPATSTVVAGIPEPSSASQAAIVLAFAAVLTFAVHLRSTR